MADDIVERLRAKDVLTNIIRSCQVIPGRHPGELADLMEEAADEIERLREALKPFADMAEMPSNFDNGKDHTIVVTVGDLRAAKAALEEK
jgi:hypothetical protein